LRVGFKEIESAENVGVKLVLADTFQLLWGVGIIFAAQERASKENVARAGRCVYSFFLVIKCTISA
jgi:hypothetical protein